ncbi:Small subunit of serine palmitoyltransferase A [Tupaia chinensis]|uniref:Small subunit of serine palmitoyltransferase A n=1 Tax=Tupaia chinensis TaxID=246437 RepID=L9JPU6_TUPCH|nr:Small subunit of serine palmitoyltransferase A [Tupaia chinensis]
MAGMVLAWAWKQKSWFYYQYLLVTALYTLEPWERTVFDSILVSIVGWHWTRDLSSCPSTSWQYGTTSKLYSDQDVTKSKRFLEDLLFKVGMRLHQMSQETLLVVNITNHIKTNIHE